MRFAAYDRVSPADPLSAFPIILEQRNARLPAATLLVLLAALLILAAIPVGLILSLAGGALWERPVAGIQGAVGLAIWFALFTFPAVDLVRRLTSSRSVKIELGRVTVTEQRLLGSATWTAPISAFDGLAHHIRTSVSGTRHELILAHSDRSRCVLIAIADRFAKPEVDRAAAMLGVREIPARDLYSTRPRVDIAPAPSLVGAALRPAAT